VNQLPQEFAFDFFMPSKRGCQGIEPIADLGPSVKSGAALTQIIDEQAKRREQRHFFVLQSLRGGSLCGITAECPGEIGLSLLVVELIGHRSRERLDAVRKFGVAGRIRIGKRAAPMR
jgi:hypothetical protein